MRKAQTLEKEGSTGPRQDTSLSLTRMFKRKSKVDTLKVAGKISKTQANSLVMLVPLMQKNADQVEKDVLRAEELLAVDKENKSKKLPFKHQKEIADQLGQAEGLLTDLFLEVDKAERLKHPQGTEIESFITVLHQRWLADCATYIKMYDQVSNVSRLDWGPVLNQKQKEVNEEYGPTMADLEKQIGSHNILHKEIEAYGSQLSLFTPGSKEQYTNLLDNSKCRKNYLSSLYDYMQACLKELVYLGEEQDKIKKQDWSDHMADPPYLRRQYENFKNNRLLSHESEVNTLQEDGDRLMELKHPASSTIEAHRDYVRGEWQKYLNLCICLEVHLDNVEDYKKYQMDSEQLSEDLTRLKHNLYPNIVSQKSNSETLLQLEAEERDVQDSEQRLYDLRRRSTTIAPLKLRRITPTRPTTVESLCDWDMDKASLARGDRFTLKSNSDTENWDVVSTDGSTKTFPGVCFLVPPPDSEASDEVDLLGKELADIKRRRAALLASLKNHNTEVSRPLESAPDPKALLVADKLDQLDGDLAQAEQDILNRLRTPLNRTDPAGDLANRLKEQERASEALKALEQQKAAVQAELEPLLSQDTSGTTSSALPLKLSAANDKHAHIAALADLFNTKANASVNLEGQIKKVDGIVSGFEEKLNEDGAIPDAPDAIQAKAQEIRSLRKEVSGSQDEMKKLGQDLETTEQLCSSLQQGYQEYCPDIQHQATQVKQLQNRYTNVNNQLKESKHLLQEAATKNQEFQSRNGSLNSFLDSLPVNEVSPSDDLSQVDAKQISQERVIEDLQRKGDDMDRVVDLSQDLQNLLNDYETNVDKYNGTLEDAGATVAMKPHDSTLAEAVQKQEKALVNRYAGKSAEMNQRLNQMDLAKDIIAQNEEKKQAQLEIQQAKATELNGLKKALEEEKDRLSHVETDLKTFNDRFLSLKSRRGVERVEEKEVVQYYRDPNLESDLDGFKKTLHEVALKGSTTQGEIEVVNNKITILEDTLKNIPPKVVTREVTEFERDPQLDIEAAKLKDEISKIKDDIRVSDGGAIQMKMEVTFLEQMKPPIREKVVRKEVVKVEKDPEMLKEVQTFEKEISDEGTKSKLLNDDIFQARSQINALERIIPTIQPKIITNEVKKIEQSPELINESKKMQSGLEDEKIENNILTKSLSDLQSRYREVQDWKPKIEVKEIVNEIYRIDPNTEAEIKRLKKDIEDAGMLRSDLEKQISLVTPDLDVKRSEKPKVELKEVVQEVVKEERSPENEREILRLNDQLNNRHSTYSSIQDKLRLLKKERDEWKAEKSKVETVVINREVIKYEDDPLLEKEADRMRREVCEEAQVRRTTEEMVFDLQNKYILLERQKPEEKVVVQQVVRLQKDPRQIVEHEKLGRNLDEEVKTRHQLELEVQQLRAKLEDKEEFLAQSDEHQKKIQAEAELREIKLRIRQLENAPSPVEESIVVEEVIKVERDPKLERMTNGLHSEMDKETNDIIRLQRDIRNTNAKVGILEKEKLGEKTIYQEVVRVEKDQAVEAERDHLREQVSKEKFARQGLEDEIKCLSDKIDLLRTTQSSSSREETSLVLNRDSLKKERDNLSGELKTLEAQKRDICRQKSRLINERTQEDKRRSIKMESDLQHLEKEILDEKDKIYKRDSDIGDLKLSLGKEESAEPNTTETNVSTKIAILDPKTGKDMSPHDAYLQGLISRQQCIHLMELESDWEEITSIGPDGETSVLQDCKSGKQYPIKDALRDGRLTQYDLQKYKDDKISISEFALLVAGENKEPKCNSVTPKSTSR